MQNVNNSTIWVNETKNSYIIPDQFQLNSYKINFLVNETDLLVSKIKQLEQKLLEYEKQLNLLKNENKYERLLKDIIERSISKELFDYLDRKNVGDDYIIKDAIVTMKEARKIYGKDSSKETLNITTISERKFIGGIK